MRRVAEVVVMRRMFTALLVGSLGGGPLVCRTQIRGAARVGTDGLALGCADRARRGAVEANPPPRPTVSLRPERQPPVWATPEWQAFLGDPPPDVHEVLAAIPSEMAPIGRANVGIYDLGHFVREALLVLRGQSD